jgi:uncharacterized protein YehS (DUF1456 family)
MEKDLLRSLSYSNVAANNRGLKSAKRMNDLEKDMTQAQMAALAKKCIDSGYKASD